MSKIKNQKSKLQFKNKNFKNSRGFSLLELLIYVAVFGAVVLVFSNFLVTMVGGRDGENARFEVLQNMRFASEKIRQLIYDSSSFEIIGSCPLNSLQVVSGGATSTVSIDGGVLKIDGPGGAEAIISGRVSATTTADCLFKKIINPLPSKPTLQLQLQISYNDNGNIKFRFSDELRTTVSQR